jgi:hypothetical protein
MKHEKTIKEHADANAHMAADQSSRDLRGGFYNYLENTIDSCLEDGHTWEDALLGGQLFAAAYAELTGFRE